MSTRSHYLPVCPQEADNLAIETSAKTFSIPFDPELAFDEWEQRGTKRKDSPFAYHSTSLEERTGDDQDELNEGNNGALFPLADPLAVPVENSLLNDDSLTVIDHAALPAPESSLNDFDFLVQWMHPQDAVCIPEGRRGSSPVGIFNAKGLIAGATMSAGTVNPETKKGSVDFEQVDSLKILPVAMKARSGQMTTRTDADRTILSSGFEERDAKQAKLDAIAVTEVDVPLDYTSQKSTVGHDVWREMRGRRRVIKAAEAEELIKKHKEELVKLGYTRDPVFLIKEGSKRAKKDSPLFAWHRNGKDFHYKTASIAAIQYAVNQNYGNEKPSLANVIQECEDKVRALETTQKETDVNAAVLKSTVQALKPFCGNEFSLKRSFINMLTRMMKEIGPSTSQGIKKAPSEDVVNQESEHGRN